MKFARHGTGGKQYARLEEMLERLKETVIYIEQTGLKRRRRGSFSLIADWQTLSKSDTGEILSVEIAVPEWVYQGIVDADHPTVLTYSREYFLLKKTNRPYAVPARQAESQKSEVAFDMSEVHHCSGSRATLKAFSRDLKNFVHSIAPNTFPDFDFEIAGEARQRKLTIRPRKPDSIDAGSIVLDSTIDFINTQTNALIRITKSGVPRVRARHLFIFISYISTAVLKRRLRRVHDECVLQSTFGR